MFSLTQIHRPWMGALMLAMATASCAAHAQSAVPESVADAHHAFNMFEPTPQRLAAERGLFDLSNRLIALSHAGTRIFAVDDYQQLRHANIGAGFEVNLIDPHALLSGQSIDASAYPTGEWRFVVMVDNRPVGLITVASLHGEWNVVAAGASELASEISRTVSQYSQQDPSAHLHFMRSQQGVADFIEVASPHRNAPPQYVPLLSARIMLARSAATSRSVTPSPALSEAEIAPALRDSIRRGMTAIPIVH